MRLVNDGKEGKMYIFVLYTFRSMCSCTYECISVMCVCVCL